MRLRAAARGDARWCGGVNRASCNVSVRPASDLGEGVRPRSFCHDARHFDINPPRRASRNAPSTTTIVHRRDSRRLVPSLPSRPMRTFACSPAEPATKHSSNECRLRTPRPCSSAASRGSESTCGWADRRRAMTTSSRTSGPCRVLSITRTSSPLRERREHVDAQPRRRRRVAASASSFPDMNAGHSG